MNKYKLLAGFNILQDKSLSSIAHITNNSQKIKKGSLFIAIKGIKYDGHTFLEDAVKKGAKAVLIEDKKRLKLLKKYPITVALSNNTRKAQGIIASRFYEKPSEKLRLIGTTGTNGKTTVSNLIEQYLSLYGQDTGVVGTIWYRFKDYVFDAGRTTPDSIHLNKILKRMLLKGAKYVSMEVSSHASHQMRIYGLNFEGGIFTNLTQDHLDYHQDMENYFKAKRMFFDYVCEKNTKAVFSINVDDFYGKRLYKEFMNKANVISYGKTSKEFKILDMQTLPEGCFFTVNFYGKKFNLYSKLRGDFNIYNISAAFSFLVRYGIDIEFLKEATTKLKPIRGRFEIVHAKDFLVINDYAHTPDALENILKSIQKLKRGRLIIVFGAGGDRDKTKRPKMGKIAENLSDIIILTSDNPRSENPKDIIEDIKTGMELKKTIFEIIDREEAIKEAIKMAKKDDIVLIAGKGHETYQIIGNNIYHFDDSDVAKKYLKMFNKIK